MDRKAERGVWLLDKNQKIQVGQGRVLTLCFVFWYPSVIKEAAILKKHNLFEDNMALPSESVSSLTDLKTPAGSNQASPARRASAILPEVPDSEILSNEVFQESGEKKQPGVPMPSPPPDGDGQVIISSTDDPVVNPVAAEDTTGALGKHSSELEFGETHEGQEPTQEKPEPTSALGSLKELRNLLMVTTEVPGESAAPEIEKDTSKETLVPQEIEKEEEMTQIYTETDQAAASSQVNSEESEVSEREVHPPSPEAEAGGVELGASPEAQPACGGLSEGARGPGPLEEPAEAGEPTERELTAGSSGLDALEGGGPRCAVEAEAMPQEGCKLSCDPVSPGESQVSLQEEAVGGSHSTAQATASVEAKKSKATRVHECQWVVESDADTYSLDSQREDPPERPSEE